MGAWPGNCDGVAIAGVVSIAMPFWNSLLPIALFYVVFSIGWAIASPVEDALVADMAPADLHGTVLGAKEPAAGIGAAMGQLTGGYIYEYWAQEMAFVRNGVLLLITSALAILWFRKP
jgi:predicted MFS family arabinose efflux permease